MAAPPNPAMLAPVMGAAAGAARAGGDPSMRAPYQNAAYGGDPYANPYAGAPPQPPTYAAGYPPPGQGPSPGLDPYTGQPVFYNQHVYGKMQEYPTQDFPVDNSAAGGASDLEGQDEVTAVTANLSTKIRHGFVRKVYVILSLQLAVTFGIALCFTLIEAMRLWIRKYWWVSLIFIGVAFITTMVLACVPHLARKVPINFLLLTLITLCYSVVIGFAGAATSSEAFAIAAGITVAVALGLTIFAIQTRWDFTGCGVYLFVSLLVLFLFGIIAVIIRNRIVHIVYASLGALLFSFMLVYDTQQIVGGKHRKYQYSIDDYIFAALTLYLDVINLFMYILSLVSAASN